MIVRAIAFLTLLWLGLGFAAARPLPAQDQQPAASKQEVARSRFRELTERMQKLMVLLQKSEPENQDAGVLGAGLQFVQEKKMHESLQRCATLLEQERWDDALDAMAGVRKDMTRLLELLQNRNVDLRKLMEQIAKLQAFRDRVDQLAKEQTTEKEASAKTEALQKHLEALAAQKAKAEALLAKQQELRDATNKLGTETAAEATKPLAEKEGALREDTEKLAKELEATEQQHQQLAAEPKAGEPKAGEPKAGEPKAGEAKPGQGNCSGNAGKAAQSMGQAQQQLSDKKPEPSLKDQDHAIESLRQTVKELEAMAEAARRELLKLPFDEQAKQQEKTEHATDTLAKDMEKSEEQGEDAEAQPTPGKKRVQQAVPKQRAAAGQLKEFKPAKQKQQDARDDLEAAKKELDDALAQLRQQLSDEVLRALEERFTAMLAKQRELSVQTKTLDKTRQNVLTASGDLPSGLVEKIQLVGTGEGDLEVEAADALKLLEEDGTTAVFPPMVEMLKDELRGVGKLLRGNDTGAPVQRGQREVEDILELLINSLRKEVERREGGGQCNGGGQPPLVPMSAELKVLRYLQDRVNRGTKDFDGKPAEQKGEVATATSEELAQKQARVRDLMRRLAAKVGKEGDAEAGR